MTNFTIYYPGLLGPDIPLEELPPGDWPAASDLPGLTQILNHAQIHPLRRCSLEARILYGMGVGFAAQGDVPVALLRAAQVDGLTLDKPLWCLDPVCLRLDQDQAVLLGNEMLELAESEARHLIEDLNAHLVQDGLQIHYLTPRQWLLQGQFDLITNTPGDALLANVNNHMPRGTDAARWRRLLNEVQMLLHTHDVNQLREQRGQLPVNSVWLWGGGTKYSYEKIIDAVYSNEDLVHDVALACDIPHYTLPEAVSDAMTSRRHTLLVLTEQLYALRHRDVYVWLEHLMHLEKKVLAPLISSLYNKTLDSLTLYSDTLSLTLTPKRSGRWWRRTFAPGKTILKLRDQYGL